MDTIIIPGIDGSGPEHWQSRWEAALPDARRFSPTSWRRPELGDWMAALEREVRRSAAPPVLVAHSLGCLLAAHWAAQTTALVSAALLVSVPDSGGRAFPAAAAGFGQVPDRPLPFPALILASENDPYADIAYMRERAAAWRASVQTVGRLGHINEDSGLGGWPDGRARLKAFLDALI